MADTIRLNIPTDLIIDAVSRDEMIGFCIDCGSERECCEPDMRKGHCDSCGLASVHGAEEILFMIVGFGAR